jgi:phosphoribosylformimino-5-aminoimidazole carboxamide ribotide isomerase
MPILPVLDLKQGQVVRGIAGRRAEYRPIVSKLTRSSRPLDVARALYQHFGFTELYIADLDGIERAVRHFQVLEALAGDGFRLWVDAGICKPADAIQLRDVGVTTFVVGLETVGAPKVLRDVCERMGPLQTVFSLDMNNSRPLGDLAHWGRGDAWGIAQRAVDAGVVRLLVLDLARVGVSGGTGTEELCARLKREHPHRELTAGGGIRGPDDVRQLYAIGVDHVLIASALHDGRITPNDVTALDGV